MLLAVDPSILNLGYAVFEGEKLICSGTVKKKDGRLTLEERIARVIRELEKTVQEKLIEYKCIVSKRDVLVIEKPQLWGAYKSVASAHSGSLLALHILVGALFWFGMETFFETHLIPVSEWKGQLPKRVTRGRMEEKYHTKFADNDESDAVGLGDYCIRERSKNKDGKEN